MKQIIITFLLFHVIATNSQNHKDAEHVNVKPNRFNRQSNYGITQEQGSRASLAVRRTAKTTIPDEMIKPTQVNIQNETGEVVKYSNFAKKAGGIDNTKEQVVPPTNKEVNLDKINATSLVTNGTKTNSNVTDEEFPDRVGKPVIITLQGR